MERATWFLDPEVLVFGQVAGVAVFCIALLITYTGSASVWLLARARRAPVLATYRRRLAPRDS